MNIADVISTLDQMKRNVNPGRILVFTVNSSGDVTIHKQYGWKTPFIKSDIVLSDDYLTITSRSSEFIADGLFVDVNTNAVYTWIDASQLRVTPLFGIANKMSVKIEGVL